MESIAYFPKHSPAPTERKLEKLVEFPSGLVFIGVRAAEWSVICLLVEAVWAVNVNMTYSKERSLERSAPGKAAALQYNGYKAQSRPPVAKETIQRLLTSFRRVPRDPSFA